MITNYWNEINLRRNFVKNCHWTLIESRWRSMARVSSLDFSLSVIYLCVWRGSGIFLFSLGQGGWGHYTCLWDSSHVCLGHYFFAAGLILFCMIGSDLILLLKLTSNLPVCLMSCSGPLWGFVVAFVLFDVHGTAYYSKWGTNSCFMPVLVKWRKSLIVSNWTYSGPFIFIYFHPSSSGSFCRNSQCLI